MNAGTMRRRVYHPTDPSRRLLGWAVVVLGHIAVIWALVTGTARKELEAPRNAMRATVIQEVIIPPPPPPPPPPKQIERPRPKPPARKAAPPPYIPPPEVRPPVSSGVAVPSVPTPPLAPAPAPPAAGPAAPSQAPAAGGGGTGTGDIGVACPYQVAPEMPRRAVREGIEGVVKAQALIRDGSVREVTILSGPRVFHSAVRAAMLQYRCVSGPADVLATQEFVFKLNQ